MHLSNLSLPTGCKKALKIVARVARVQMLAQVKDKDGGQVWVKAEVLSIDGSNVQAPDRRTAKGCDYTCMIQVGVLYRHEGMNRVLPCELNASVRIMAGRQPTQTIYNKKASSQPPLSVPPSLVLLFLFLDACLAAAFSLL